MGNVITPVCGGRKSPNHCLGLVQSAWRESKAKPWTDWLLSHRALTGSGVSSGEGCAVLSHNGGAPEFPAERDARRHRARAPGGRILRDFASPSHRDCFRRWVSNTSSENSLFLAGKTFPFPELLANYAPGRGLGGMIVLVCLICASHLPRKRAERHRGSAWREEQAQGCEVRASSLRAGGAGAALGRSCQREPGAPRITGAGPGLWTWGLSSHLGHSAYLSS